MSHRHLVPLVLIATAAGLGACAAQRSPAPAATPAEPAPAQPAPASEQHEEQTVAPAAPAGQAAPGSANQQYRATEKAPSSLTTGETKTTALEFKSVSDAEKALAKANQQLVALYAPASTPAMGGATRGSAGKPTAKKAAEANAEADKESRCATACKAFASLKRAADAVCRLAGDNDARCAHAKKLVDENGRRVAQCGCRDGG